MDIIERFHQKFGRWYERLFNDAGEQALRPKDVLRKILDAMEEHRNEGFDGKIYVPNKYVLELAVSDPDEHDYLLSFLDEEELASVLRRYMAQNGYSTRGPLDFTILDVRAQDAVEKLTVKVRFEKGATGNVGDEEEPPVSPPRVQTEMFEDDMLTVAGIPYHEEDEDLTVAAVPRAWAALVVTSPDGHRSLATVSNSQFTIGRSRQAGNDLVLSSDGQVSKRHARIEREPDGKATIYDLESTNGIVLNGKMVSGNATLQDGDQIIIGTSTIVFQQDMASDVDMPGQNIGVETPQEPVVLERARLIPRYGGNAHRLASDTLIGQAVTCDIILGQGNASMRQAQIISPDGINYYLQDLAGNQTTRVNERVIYGEERWRLTDGDIIDFGNETYTFIAPTSNPL